MLVFFIIAHQNNNKMMGARTYEKFRYEPFQLIEQLAGDPTLGVGDGSAKDRMGSFGW
jgi:hypothetical protein